MQKESQQARPWGEVAGSEQFQALPAEHQERARELYFQDNVMPRVPKGMEQRARELFDQDSLGAIGQPAKQGQGEIGAMDFAKETGAGLLKGTGVVVSGLGDMIRPDDNGLSNKLPDGTELPEIPTLRGAIADAIDPAARAAGSWLDEKGQAVADSKSQAAKEALAKSTPAGDILAPDTWDMGQDPSLAGYGLQMSGLVGQFVPQAGAMLATRGRAVQTPAMMAVGGLQAGGAAGNEVEQRIAATSDLDLLADSPVYRQLREKGLGEKEARQQLTLLARDGAFDGAAPVGALGGLATQVALGPLQRAIGGSVGRRLAGSLAIEAPVEGLQEVAETVAARAGVNDATGEQRSLTAGTFADFTLGAMGGAGFSVAGTAASALGGEAKVSRPGLDLDAAIDAAIDEAFAQSERPDDSEQLARQSLDPANAQIQADQARPAVAGLQAVPGTTVQQDVAPTVVAEASVAPAAAPPAAQDAAQPAAREQPADNGTGVFRVPVEQIKVDPQAYQFRSKVDDKGTDKRLDAVAKWDDRRSGSVVLHRRADGSLYVADGHHRVALAKRLGQPAINAVILDEADGVDVPAARREAAMINISGGNAEALDVAKVFRDSAESPAEVRAANNLPANQATADGQALASLGDNVFGMVAAGQLDEKSGAAIGAGFSEPAQQEEAARVFQKIQPATAYQRELLVQEIRSAEFTAQQGEQPSLFGDDEQQVSLLQNRLAVLDKLRQALNADKRLFASLNDNADRAVQAGNTIATEANAQITEASKKSLAMLGRITTTPALNQMVNRASQRIAGGEPVAAVVRELKKEMIGYGQDATGARRTDSAGGQSPDRTGAVAGASQRLPALDANGADQAREPGPAREGARSAVQPTEDFQLGQQSETELAEADRQQKERDKTEAAKQKKLDDAKKKADNLAFIKQQNEAAAATFTLGQNAEDSVTGQGGMFDSAPSLSELGGKPATDDKHKERAVAVELAIYRATNADPFRKDDAPLSDEDVLFILETLLDRARAGKLTTEQFAQSEIGERLDTGVMMALNEFIRQDPVAAIQAMLDRVDARKPANQTAVKDEKPAVESAKADDAPASQGSKKPEARQAITQADELPDSSIIEDGKGKQYRVHYQRGNLVQAHPIVDGKAEVNSESGVRFHVGDPASADGRRTDPIYLVQARSNSGSLAEGGSKKGTSIPESADEYAARLRSLADEFDGTYYGRSLSPVARAMADHAIESGRRMTDAELEGLARQHDVPLDVIEQLTGNIFTYDAVLGASQRGEAGATALLRRARGNAIGSAEAGAPAVERAQRNPVDYLREIVRQSNVPAKEAIAAARAAIRNPDRTTAERQTLLEEVGATGAGSLAELNAALDKWWKRHSSERAAHKAKGQAEVEAFERQRREQDVEDTLALGRQAAAELDGRRADPVREVNQSAAEPKPAKVEDFGEKLGGARKDELRSVRERLDDMDDAAIAGSSLSQLWPKGELDKISEPFEAALYHVVRGLIPAKPRVPYRVKGWVAKVKAAREILTRLGKMDAGATADKMRAFSPDLGIVADQIEVLMALDRKHWGRVDSVRRASGRYNQDGEMVPGSWVNMNVDGRQVSFYGHDTVASAIPAIKEQVEGKSAPEKRMKFAVYSDRQTGDVFVAKDGDAEMRRLKTFKTVKEARSFLNDEYEAAVALWDAVKNRDNVTKSDMRRATNDPRVGQNHRDSKDVTPEQFLEAFGFRGVEFGNWVKQGAGGRERQGMLNDAYDAFMDLAGILSIPPKALSLEGKLGIGFGSRGSGKASAHYEPDLVVINMTKTKGAGALAHEWFHALDNYFARRRAEQPGSNIAMKDRETAYITYRPERMWVNKKYPSMQMPRAELTRYQGNHPDAPLYQESNWEPDANHPNGVRPQVEKAFAELVATLNASPMLQRAKVIDGKTSDGYWSRIIERGARSFETYVIARLADQGFRNDYLANVQTLEQFSRDPGRYPYLTPDEQGPVNEAFDKLFATLETKETDLGVALFSRAGSPIDQDGLSESSVVTGKVPENPISLEEAISAAEQFLADYNGNIELSYRIRKKQDELYGPGSIAKIGVIKGAYHPGRGLFTLAADHLSDSADVRETLRHEILGHYGLDTFRPSDKQAFLEKIIESRGEPSLKAAWAHVDKAYGDMAEIVKAEEVFAFLAEQDRGVIVKALDALRSSIVRLLRAVGYKRKVVTRAELLREVEVIAKGIRSGRRSYQGTGDGTARLRLLGEEPAIAAQPEQGRLGIDTEQQAAGIELPAETAPRKAQRLLQDKLNRFTVIREWLAERGVDLGEDADVYRAEERMHSRFSNKAKDFREKTVQPLVEKIQQAGYAMEDVAQYLHAQHAQERNAQIARINRQMPDGGSGMSNAEAREILAGADQKLVRLANELRAITDGTRKVLLDSGLIGKEQADAWQKAYQHYVPLKGGPDDKAAQAGTGKGLKVQHKTKRALGHKVRGEGEWIIENILADHERALLAAEKNTVAKHLLKMAMRLQQTDLDIMTVGQPEKRGVLRNQVSYEVLYKGRPVGAFDTQEGAQLFKASAPLSIGKAASPADVTIRKSNDPSVVYMASPMPAPNEAQVYIDGDIIRIQIKDDLLARAYGNMGADALGTFMRSAQALNRWFSSVYTGYNPEFLITNVIRDFTTGLANITGEEGALFAAKATKNYFTSFAALLRYASKGATDPWIRQYREDGGNTGAAYLSDLERLGADMQAEYAAYQGVMANLRKGSLKGAARAAGRKAFNATLRHLEALNEAGENAMRLALYRTAVEQGMTRNKAASMAKNTTVNFNRKGELGAQANALYLFFNAGVQGTTSLAHAHFKGKNRQQAWAVSGAMAALGYSLAMLVAGGEDDENEKTPDYTKERNLVIPLGDGKSLTIPVPYGYGFYFNVGRLLAEAQRTGKTDDMAWQLASSFAGEFTPFSGAVAGDEPDMLQTGLFLLPTMAQIPMAVATNRSSFGGPMYPENPNKRYEPDRLKMWRGTEGTWADSLAGALESVGADVSPETLKHMSRTFTGGAGNFVGSTIDAATLSAQGATPEVREVPFLRKFYRENGVGDARSRFWRYQGEARKAVEDFQRAVDAGDRERVQTIVRENRELIAMADVAKAFSEAAGAARDRVQQIRLGDLPIAEKRAQIQKIEEREAELYDRFVRVFKERAREK